MPAATLPVFRNAICGKSTATENSILPGRMLSFDELGPDDESLASWDDEQMND